MIGSPPCQSVTVVEGEGEGEEEEEEEEEEEGVLVGETQVCEVVHLSQSC